MKHDFEKIQDDLAGIDRYKKLILKVNEVYPPLDSFLFEAFFAHSAEKSGLRFQYEVNVNLCNETTVDFVIEEDEYKFCCELLSPDLSDSLKLATTPQNTDIDGVKYYEVLMEGNHPNEHLRPEAQTIRLQEKLLEKVDKFPKPIENVFCTIVINCKNFHFGHFDSDDSRMVMYGKTKVPEFQEYWGDSQILGLLNPSLKKKCTGDFRAKVTAVIFIPKISIELLKDGFLILNHHRSNDHLQKFWGILKKYEAFHKLKYLPFPT